MLIATVAATASGPWMFGGSLTEFLAPAAAACKSDVVFSMMWFTDPASHGDSSRCRVAVADGKEVSAAIICCASEADGLLANAERTKAITP